MTFGERVVGALKLDANTFEDIERDPTAMGQAVGIIALAALASNLGQIWRLGFGVMLIGVCSSLVGYVIWAVVVWLAGTKLMPDPATKADFPETFRTIAFAAAPGLIGVVTIVPFLGWLLMLSADADHLALVDGGNGRRRPAGPRLLGDIQGRHRRPHRLRRLPRVLGNDGFLSFGAAVVGGMFGR